MLRSLLIPLLLISLISVSSAGTTKQAVFAVGCYDVGAAALENRPGVLQVHKGWQQDKWYHFQEVNRVEYDPQQVSVEQLESWLKEVWTWRETLPEANKE
jgi:peptide methionine sulfoxide reductase MsrA